MFLINRLLSFRLLHTLNKKASRSLNCVDESPFHSFPPKFFIRKNSLPPAIFVSIYHICAPSFFHFVFIPTWSTANKEFWCKGRKYPQTFGIFAMRDCRWKGGVTPFALMWYCPPEPFNPLSERYKFYFNEMLKRLEWGISDFVNKISEIWTHWTLISLSL